MQLRKLERGGGALARAGFTLMELLVVIAILLVLVSVATPVYLSYKAKADRDITKSSCDSLARDLKTSLSSYGVTSKAQVEAQFNGENWSLLTLPPDKSPPRDAWGTALRWGAVDVQNQLTEEYIVDVYVQSAGPDREFGTPDDIYGGNPYGQQGAGAAP